jgi:hypothetical protein
MHRRSHTWPSFIATPWTTPAEEAKVVLEKALEFNPASAEARELLGRISGSVK